MSEQKPLVAEDQLRHDTVSPDTLGYLAVSSDEQKVALMLNDDHDFRKNAEAKIGVQDGIEDVKLRLRELVAEDTQFFRMFVNDSMPPMQKARLLEDKQLDPKIDTIDWLMGEDSVTKSKIAQSQIDPNIGDRRLMNYLQSHIYLTEKSQQNPEFLKIVDKAKQEWQEYAIRGVQEGCLDKNAAARIVNVEACKVYAGDDFATMLMHRSGNAKIEAQSDGSGVAKDGIVVYKKPTTVLVKHELNHTRLQTWAAEGSSPMRDYVWLYEAITEEVAMYMEGVAPLGESTLEQGAYRPARSMLRELLTYAKTCGADIEFADLTRAYSASPEDQKNMMLDLAMKAHAAGVGDHNMFRMANDFYVQELANLSDQEKALPVSHRNKLAAQRAEEQIRTWRLDLAQSLTK